MDVPPVFPAHGFRLTGFIIAAILVILCNPRSAQGNDLSSFNWFWTFYESEAVADTDSVSFRPFFLQHRDARGVFQASLMPGVFWRYKTDSKDDIKALFGLVQSLEHVDDQGQREYDLAVFPFLFFGHAKQKKDRYALVWPFGGELKGKFGYERISAYVFPGLALFVLFPHLTIFCNPTLLATVHTFVFAALSYVPVYARFEQGAYRAHAILWPLIMWGEGPGRKDLRVLPFFARLSKENFYDRYNVLMIFNYQKTYYRDDVHHAFFFFPLFGRKWSRSGEYSSYTVLWPFFSWGRSEKKGEREFNIPWPLVQIRDSEKPRVRKRIFFPFYGDYRFERDRTFFVTPLYFAMTKESARFNSAYYICGIVFWHFRREYHGGTHDYYGNSWRYYKLWPLFQHEHNDRGDLRFVMLSLLPFRDADGYEKLYQPLWTLF
jgi:hypothetical protein